MVNYTFEGTGITVISQLPAGANGQYVKTSAGSVTWYSRVAGDVTGELGFTPENNANKGAASGYAGLNGSSQVTNNIAAVTQLPSGSNNQALKTNGSGTVVWGTYAGLLDTDTAEKQANKGAASGYASLDAGGVIPDAQNTRAEKTANKGAASGYAGLNGSSQVTNNLAAITQLPAGSNNQALKTNGSGTVVWGTFAGLLDTDTAEKQANKGAASGYAGLNASSQVTNNLAAITQLPAGSNNQALKTNGSGAVVWGTFAGLLDTDTAEKQANKGAASGYAGLDASSLVPSANLKGSMILNNLRLTGFGANTSFTSIVYATTLDSGTESVVQVANPSDNSPILKKMVVKFSSNSFNGTMIWKTRKNGADGNLTVTIGAGATGLFYDSTHSDTLAQGDLICYELTPGTANAGSGNVDYVAVMSA